MILAATGHYKDAAELQRRIVTQVESGRSNTAWLDLLKENLVLYENGKAAVQAYVPTAPDLNPPRITLEERRAMNAPTAGS